MYPVKFLITSPPFKGDCSMFTSFHLDEFSAKGMADAFVADFMSMEGLD
jgi:hypothetical protein